ncbi:MAG: hypothetical protein WCJ36_01855 [Candidatus Saccharibacteria bacterium]
MYSGTTFRRDSGRIIGVHQKIDRAARRHLTKYITKGVEFPGIRDILHFEGTNGPDAIRYMNKDEPWHFIDPTKPEDKMLISLINDHIFNLTEALKKSNKTRAGFESAWLAHAVTDGLTPAHHYPLGDKIEELWGKPRDERTNLRDKNIIRGSSRRDTLSKNWQYWGAGGVFTAHLMFEMGVATAIIPDKFEDSSPDKKDIARLEKDGFETVFMESLQKIYAMKLYDEFCKKGWTWRLAAKVRKQLVPEIVKTVTLAWYQALILTKES